jgi:hypothetical protein
VRTLPVIDRDSPIRLIGDCTKQVAKGTLDYANSPLSGAEWDAVWNEIKGHSIAALAIMAKETQYGRVVNGKFNPFNTLSPGGFDDYDNWAEGCRAGMLRLKDYTFKSGVYEPDISVAAFHQTYIGGPTCRTSNYATCANGESKETIELAITQFIDRSNRLVRANAGTGAPPPDPGPDPDPPPGSGQIAFGRVPRPTWVDRIIPDANNVAWDNLGQRQLRGIVYHRQVGTNWGTDGWFRTMWYRDQWGNLQKGGGQLGLTDFGIDRNSGEILQWNDYRGHGRSGVSPNRAGYASGPWQRPPGDGVLFVDRYGVNAINRDLVSLEIDGWYDSPIAAAGMASIVNLSAYLADQAKIPWDRYPIVPSTGLVFTYSHDEFQNHKPCPGSVVLNLIPTIIERTKSRLKEFQVV